MSAAGESQVTLIGLVLAGGATYHRRVTDAANPHTSTGPEDVLPSEAELSRRARPATVRRAPRVKVFVAVGVLLGALAGFLVALALAGAAPEQLAAEQGTAFVSVLEGEGAVRLVSALAGAGVGALAGAAGALWADRRSLRHR